MTLKEDSIYVLIKKKSKLYVMNVNITGIYDNTVIVDSNLFSRTIKHIRNY